MNRKGAASGIARRRKSRCNPGHGHQVARGHLGQPHPGREEARLARAGSGTESRTRGRPRRGGGLVGADAVDECLIQHPGFQIRGNSLGLNNCVAKLGKSGGIAGR